MGLWEDIKETFGIIGTVLTTKWLWLIVGWGVYVVLQAYLMLIFFPSILVLPACLIIYMLWDENKRTKSQYGFKKPVVETTKWDVSSSVDNYIKTLTKAQILNEDRKKDSE